MMRILFPGSKSIGIAVSLVLVSALCVSSYKLNKQAQIEKYKKQLAVYESFQNDCNAAEIKGTSLVN